MQMSCMISVGSIPRFPRSTVGGRAMREIWELMVVEAASSTSSGTM